jgi:hypothetical protein
MNENYLKSINLDLTDPLRDIDLINIASNLNGYTIEEIFIKTNDCGNRIKFIDNLTTRQISISKTSIKFIGFNIESALNVYERIINIVYK